VQRSHREVKQTGAVSFDPLVHTFCGRPNISDDLAKAIADALSERSPFSRSVSFRSLAWLLEARLANESRRAGKSEDHDGSSHVSGLRSVALNIADMNAARTLVRVWHLSVADRSGDAVYLRATGTDHHVLSLHKLTRRRLHITSGEQRRRSGEDRGATKAAWHDRVAGGAGAEPSGASV